VSEMLSTAIRNDWSRPRGSIPLPRRCCSEMSSEAFRAFDTLTGSGQEAVAEAFGAEAANVRTDAGLLAQFGAVANLHHRARTLGQGDPGITRIAFEESVRNDAAGSPTSRTGRCLARLMAPGKT